MKNILIFAYYFPPQSNGGTPRPFSLYKYLPKYGWSTTVVTVSCFGQLHPDNNILRFDALRNWKSSDYKPIKLLLNALSIARWKWLTPQVYDILWSHKVISNLDAIFAGNRFDAIYATFPSIDCLNLGLITSKKYSIPLVAEFRDGLVFEPVDKPSSLVAKKIAAFEKQVLCQSRAVITIGDVLSSDFRERYPSKNIHTIYNGFDSADFSSGVAFDSIQRNYDIDSKKTYIFHFGSLGRSRKRDISPLFFALMRLKNEGTISSENLELRLVGKPTQSEAALIRRFDLLDIIKTFPPIPKEQGFRWMMDEATHLLFYGVPGSRTIISTKLLEYLNIGKPIIGICKGNEAENIICGTNTGIVVDFDEESIAYAFASAVRKEIDYQPNVDVVASFDRESQTEKIAEVLNKAV